MEMLKSALKDYNNGEKSALETLVLLSRIYLVNQEELEENQIKIEFEDYGVFKLYKDDYYTFEGQETECYERAYDLMNKKL